jgi:hypothetical protein
VNIRIADPLPECQLCGAPTRRAVHERNAGLCSTCTDGIADTVRMLPVRDTPADAGRHAAEVLDLDAERDRRRPDDDTAYVERYLPPVPGQLTITPDEDLW